VGVLESHLKISIVPARVQIDPASWHRCSRNRMTVLGKPYRISKCSRANWYAFETDD
jgi:hypothetical protein